MIHALNKLNAGSTFLIYEVHKLLDIFQQMIYMKSHNNV